MTSKLPIACLTCLMGMAFCDWEDRRAWADSATGRVAEVPVARKAFQWPVIWRSQPRPEAIPTLAAQGSLLVPLDEPSSADNSIPLSLSQRIARESQTGTLLFSEGDCLAVKVFTGSRFTHVATLVFIDGTPWVYDSMNGTGVRKLTLEEYLAVQAPDEVTMYHPRRPFSPEEAQAYCSALESQVGRPYSVRHFLTGQRTSGLHCAEYVTDSLMGIGWLQCDNPVRVSPSSLLTGIELSEIYREGSTLPVSHPLEPIPEPGYWCGERWQAAILCMDGCCTRLSRIFLCR